MIYKLAFKKSAARDLKKLEPDQVDRILKKIEVELPKRADQFPSLKGKFAGLRRFRVGDYRVIYTLIDDTALILRISHRRESYR